MKKQIISILFTLGVLFGIAVPAHGQSYGILAPGCSLSTSQGQAVAGATVTILTEPANVQQLTPLATVHSSTTGGTVTQPLSTNGFGQCVTSAGNQPYLAEGLYTVVFSSPYTGTVVLYDQPVLLPSGGSGSIVNPISGIQWPIASGSSLPSTLCPTGVTGNLTSGSPTILGVNSFTDVYVGQQVTGTGIPAGTYIQSVNSSAGSVTLTQNATTTQTGVSLSFYSIGQPFQDTETNQESFCGLGGWQIAVQKIIAGTGIAISPSGGTGAVTISTSGAGSVGAGLVPEVPYYDTTTGVEGDPNLFDYSAANIALASSYTVTEIAEDANSVVTVTLSAAPPIPANSSGWQVKTDGGTLPTGFGFLGSGWHPFLSISGTTLEFFDASLHGTQAGVPGSTPVVISGIVGGAAQGYGLNYAGLGINFSNFSGGAYNYYSGDSPDGAGSSGTGAGFSWGTFATKSGDGSFVFNGTEAAPLTGTADFSVNLTASPIGACCWSNVANTTFTLTALQPDANSANFRVITDAPAFSDSPAGNVSFQLYGNHAETYLDFENSFLVSEIGGSGGTGACQGCLFSILDNDNTPSSGDSSTYSNTGNATWLQGTASSPMDGTNSDNFSVTLQAEGWGSGTGGGAKSAADFAFTTNVTVLSGWTAENLGSGNFAISLSNTGNTSDGKFSVASTGPSTFASSNFTMDAGGDLALQGALTIKGGILPGILYSAAGTPLPSCAVGIKGQSATVSDATSPTFLGAYTSGGAVTAPVVCSYNGTSYGWVTP